MNLLTASVEETHISITFRPEAEQYNPPFVYTLDERVLQVCCMERPISPTRNQIQNTPAYLNRWDFNQDWFAPSNWNAKLHFR